MKTRGGAVCVANGMCSTFLVLRYSWLNLGCQVGCYISLIPTPDLNCSFDPMLWFRSGRPGDEARCYSVLHEHTANTQRLVCLITYHHHKLAPSRIPAGPLGCWPKLARTCRGSEQQGTRQAVGMSPPSAWLPWILHVTGHMIVMCFAQFHTWIIIPGVPTPIVSPREIS